MRLQLPNRVDAGSILFALDVLMMAGAWSVSLAIAAPPCAGGLFAIFLIAHLLSVYALGLYRRDVTIETRRAFSRVPLAVLFGSVLAGAPLIAGVLGTWLRAAGGEIFMMSVGAFLTAELAARLIFRSLRRNLIIRQRVLVIGAGRRAWELMFLLEREGRSLRYELLFLYDPSLGEIDPRLRDPAYHVVTAPMRSVVPLARRMHADQVVVAPDDRRGVDLEGLLACKTAGFPVREYLSFLERELRRVDIKRIEASWVLYCDGFHFGLVDRFLKRAIDLAIAVPLLLVASPFVVAAMAAVRLQDGGPALYRQTRVTSGGRNFEILKLRTMSVHAESAGAAWAAAADPRITQIGQFLRRTRLDEVPQLINVLRGEMSLVGPRPERPNFVKMLAAQIPLYSQRHIVKAGLTGWAQINYPYGASIDDARSKLSYDLFYVKNFSVLLDLAILAQTVRVVLWPSGVR